MGWFGMYFDPFWWFPDYKYSVLCSATPVLSVMAQGLIPMETGAAVFLLCPGGVRGISQFSLFAFL